MKVLGAHGRATAWGEDHEGIKAALLPAPAPAPTTREVSAIRHATGLEFKSNTHHTANIPTQPCPACPLPVRGSGSPGTKCQPLPRRRPPLVALPLSLVLGLAQCFPQRRRSRDTG